MATALHPGALRGSSDRHISDLFPKYLTKEEYDASRQALDGFDAKKEAFQRRGNQLFLKRLCAELKLNLWVEQSAMTYVERFFARRAYADNDRFLVVGAALSLACKACDTPRPIKHIAYHYLRVKLANKPEELAALQKDVDKMLADMELAQGLMVAERAILFAMNFDVRDFNVTFRVKEYLRALGVYTLSGPEEVHVGPNRLTDDACGQLSNVAIRFAADTYKTPLVVLLPPERLAMAAVHMAAVRLSVTLEPISDAALKQLGAGWVRLEESEQQLFSDTIMAIYQSKEGEAGGNEGASTPSVAPTTTAAPAAQPASKPVAAAAAPATAPVAPPSAPAAPPAVRPRAVPSAPVPLAPKPAAPVAPLPQAPRAPTHLPAPPKPAPQHRPPPPVSAAPLVKAPAPRAVNYSRPPAHSKPKPPSFMMPKPKAPAYSRPTPPAVPRPPSYLPLATHHSTYLAPPPAPADNTSPTDPVTRAMNDDQNNNNNTPELGGDGVAEAPVHVVVPMGPPPQRRMPPPQPKPQQPQAPQLPAAQTSSPEEGELRDVCMEEAAGVSGISAAAAPLPPPPGSRKRSRDDDAQVDDALTDGTGAPQHDAKAMRVA